MVKNYTISEVAKIFNITTKLLYRSIGLTIKDIKSILDNNQKENYLTHFNNWAKTYNKKLVYKRIDKFTYVIHAK